MSDGYYKAVSTTYIIYYNIRPYVIRWGEEEGGQALMLSHSAPIHRHGCSSPLPATPQPGQLSPRLSGGHPCELGATVLATLGILLLGSLGHVGVKTEL